MRATTTLSFGLCLALSAFGAQAQKGAGGPAGIVAAVGVESVQGNPQHVPLGVDIAEMQTLRVTLRGRGGYTQRDGCPAVSSLTNASFTGGTYTAQGGFAQGEIAAASYTLPGHLFPLKITMIEAILAQQNATADDHRVVDPDL
jgi:hypothetical protein